MRKEEFIPGKIYTTASGDKWHYVGPNPVKADQGFFLNINQYNAFSFSYSVWPWEEYKEPRKGTRWMNVCETDDGRIYSTNFTSKSDADICKINRIACVEVPWVEGQGL